MPEQIVNIYKPTMILCPCETIPQRTDRRPAPGGIVTPGETHIEITQLSPFGHTRVFSGSPQVHSAPGGVINDGAG
jgi:hypothetical protein